MSTVIAYVLVVPLVPFCLTGGVFLVGFPVAICLAWAPISLRTKVAGVIGGVAGVAFAVAFGYGVFRLVVGPDSFTVGAFLASTVPLLLPLRSDFLQSRRVKTACQQLLETVRESRGDDDAAILAVNALLAVEAGSARSLVAGEIAGLVLATAWFFSR